MNVDVEESLLVGAAAEKVYAILAQPKHHKRILPECFVRYEWQSDQIVEFTVEIGSIKRDFRVRVDQIEPNKVLHETDLATGIVTEFRLLAHDRGTVATIATHYNSAATFSGWMEALFAPRFLKKLYNDELINLGRYVLVADVSVV
jgi:carbon monoxide dehydrogenase subunit G